MGSSDELVAKLRGGSASNYDVISPSSDVAAAIARTGLAAPLDLSKLPSYPQLSSKLRDLPLVKANGQDRKSTRLNSSHVKISYAVFCLKKKKESLNNHAA